VSNIYDNFEGGEDYERLLDELVTDDELDLMSERYREVMGKDYDEETLTNIIAWITMTRFEMNLIDMCVRDGLLVADWDEVSDEPLIHSTKEYRELVDKHKNDFGDRVEVEKLISDIFQDNDND
jgi:hypothetical protein